MFSLFVEIVVLIPFYLTLKVFKAYWTIIWTIHRLHERHWEGSKLRGNVSMDTGFHFPWVSNLPNAARANDVSSKLGVQNEISLLNTFKVR